MRALWDLTCSDSSGSSAIQTGSCAASNPSNTKGQGIELIAEDQDQDQGMRFRGCDLFFAGAGGRGRGDGARRRTLPSEELSIV